MDLFIDGEDTQMTARDLKEEGGGAPIIIIIGKQNAPTGVVKLAFIEQWTKFENLAYETQ